MDILQILLWFVLLGFGLYIAGIVISIVITLTALLIGGIAVSIGWLIDQFKN